MTPRPTRTILLAVALLLALSLVVLAWHRSESTFDRYTIPRHPGLYVLGSFRGNILFMSLTSTWFYGFLDPGFASGPAPGTDWPSDFGDIFPTPPHPPTNLILCQYSHGTFQQPGIGMTMPPGVTPPVETCNALIIPYWLPTAILAFAAAILGLRTLRRHRPRSPTLCTHCHYDLRAHLAGQANSVLSPQSSSRPPRCPECGIQIPTAPPAPHGSSPRL